MMNTSFVSFGCDSLNGDDRDEFTPIKKLSEEFQQSESTKNSNSFPTENLMLDILGDDIIDNYLEECNQRVKELTEIKSYPSPMFIFNTHHSEIKSQLCQKLNTNDFQIQSPCELYTLTKSLGNWLDSYGNYSHMKF